MARPTIIPSWATTGTRTTPTPTQQADGWVPGTAALSGVMNWLQGYVGEWISWLHDHAAAEDETNHWAAEQVFLASSALVLSASAPQTVTKIGTGELVIQNAADSILVQSASGTAATVRSGSTGARLQLTFAEASLDAPLAMGANKITGLAAPAADTDADTQGARNTAVGAILKARLSGSTNGSGTYTVDSGKNIASWSSPSTGTFDIVFTAPMGNVAYSPVANIWALIGGNLVAGIVAQTNKGSGGVSLQAKDHAGNALDLSTNQGWLELVVF